MIPADLWKAFEAKLKEGIPNPPGHFHPLDLERVKDEKYLQRVIEHVNGDPKLALQMLWGLLIWRQSINANDINESKVRMDYIKKGIFFPRGRDLDGCLVFIFKTKLYIKAELNPDDINTLIYYWIERMEREENGKPITVFFDMDGSGFANMDLDLVRHLITVFKLYYPAFVNYIIIYNMPWAFQAAFKVVKPLLPPQAVERLRFLNKDTLKTIIAPEQALRSWGGKDDYVFEFVPEKSSDHSTKKVTFAEQEESNHSPGEMLSLNPNGIVNFKNKNSEISGEFTITNMEEKDAISYKIRTTSPEKFRVRPSSGTLPSGSSQTISIVVQPGYHLDTVTKDKFLVMAVQIPKIDLSANELADFWHNLTESKIDKYRLKCQFPDADLKANGTVLNSESQNKQDTANSLQKLQSNYEMLHRDIRKLEIFQFLTLFMILVAVVFGYLVFRNMNVYNGHCEKM